MQEVKGRQMEEPVPVTAPRRTDHFGRHHQGSERR